MPASKTQVREGFVVAYHGAAKEYFTSSSSYDRPQWVPLDEATVYHSADLAQAAARKLWTNGSISAKVKPLKELSLDLEMPNEEPPQSTQLPSDDAQDTEMVAAKQSADSGDEIEGVCPDCDCQPCECEVDDLDSSTDAELKVDPMSADELDGNTIRLSDADPTAPPSEEYDETDPRTWDKRGEYQDEETLLGQHVKAAAGMESEEVARLHPAEVKMLGKKRADMKESSVPIADIKIKDKVDIEKQEPVKMEHDEKVSVPSEIKSQLKAVISDFDKIAKDNDQRDDDKASFALTASSALTSVLDELNTGTVESIKRAQVLLSSFMSPISSYVPSDVVKFLARGGRKFTLKDLFSSKWSDTKDK